ncbi:putative conserved RIO1-domain protein [Trypanosoma rangeli]|uniref:Serine/threonine-protein kinase RIO2 n=1 Tax=Trypanosoma rangeli TaxID=5698 RepID=A0A3R7N743_TRYRA|nr:putative conserved RIO1-domain protein [Trypanosoma rangeli]RNF01358.1 putative conserved RIO1-domain protein [Trypanosoma rangeli]|eukprot:RNF01358.1 putative conserved RIO1-domain protein [Trypanosoma rangeli]
MVKLDVSLLRFLEEEDFRVLTALEMTMRNHDVAPTALIERIAQLPYGGCRKRLKCLLKHKMIHHENTMYDGYAMKYGAYDYLALRTLCKRGTVAAVGHRIGCGKESDIILVKDESGNECVLKLQRLGRCSFRSVTRNRDYKGGGRARHGESWFYLSRLAAEKEFSFMKTLYDEGFPVPKPIDQNRHALLMELVDGTLLNNITALGDPEKVYRRSLDLMIKLGEHGLVHGDFNEFNLMITEDMRVIVIDFPQMVSTNHPNAAELFSRDVENLANFFHRRFKVKSLFYPTLERDVERKAELDRVVFASGCFSSRQQQDLERLLQTQLASCDEADGEGEDDDEDEDCEGDAVGTTIPSGTTPEGIDGAGGAQAFEENGAGDTEEENEGRQQQQQQQHPEDEGDDGGCDGNEDEVSSVARSLDEAVDEAAVERRGQWQQQQQNVNFNPDGTVNEGYVRSQVRRNIRCKDNHQFNLGLHRNVQKGRQKQKIRRQIKQGINNGFFD